ISAATCRGGLPSVLARRSATFDWKCPNSGRVAARSSASTPAASRTRAPSCEGRESTISDSPTPLGPARPRSWGLRAACSLRLVDVLRACRRARAGTGQHELVPQPLQPFLHDLVSQVAAPTQVWSDHDGQVRPRADDVAGVVGLLHGDVRLLSGIEIAVDDDPGVPV